MILEEAERQRECRPSVVSVNALYPKTFSNATSSCLLDSFDWLVDSSPYSATQVIRLYRTNAGYLSPNDDDDDCSTWTKISPATMRFRRHRRYRHCACSLIARTPRVDLQRRHKFRPGFHRLAERAPGSRQSQSLRSFQTVPSTLRALNTRKTSSRRKSLDRSCAINTPPDHSDSPLDRLPIPLFDTRTNSSAKRPNSQSDCRSLSLLSSTPL